MLPIDATKKVSEVGEFGLIERLAQTLGAAKGDRLVLGIGDDAAAWRPSPRCLTVATTDTLVEGIHFNDRTMGWEDLGWKALAENISDVAAMGCQPRYALVALALPPQQSVEEIESLYVGMKACASWYGCAVIGGDVVRSNQVTIQVTLIGESLAADGEADRPLLERSTAKIGDVIAVSGPLGGSAGGLRVLLGWADASIDAAAAERLRAAHRRPLPRAEVGLALVEEGVRCAMDISDGLLADLAHICELSGVDAEIDVASVPLFPGLEKIIGPEATNLALTGGEDYELVCTAPRATIDRVNAALEQRKVDGLTVIGSVVKMAGQEPAVRALTPEGRVLELADSGWDHFRQDQRE